MSADKPNHLEKNHQGDSAYKAAFGSVVTVLPIPLSHRPHVKAWFQYGLTIELDPVTAVDFARRLQEALAMLPNIPEIHDAIGVGDE